MIVTILLCIALLILCFAVIGLLAQNDRLKADRDRDRLASVLYPPPTLRSKEIPDSPAGIFDDTEPDEQAQDFFWVEP